MQQSNLWVTMSAKEDEQSAIENVKSWCAGHARFLQRRDELPDSLEQHRDEMEAAAEAYIYPDTNGPT